MGQEHDFWWFVANIAYYLADWTVKLLGFAAVMVGAYLALMTFGGPGLAVAVVGVAAWRLTRDIAKIKQNPEPPERNPYDFHKRK